MDEPEDVLGRRWRHNLMTAIKTIADTNELRDLHDTELLDGFFDWVGDDGAAHYEGAMTPEERASVRDIFLALNTICAEAREVGRRGSRGRVTHGLEPRDLIALGWFDVVQPKASQAFETFSQRGWMDENLGH